MNKHTQVTLDRILGSPAPRDLEWTKFVRLWTDIAEEVEQESGDRLAVRMNGHRVVFRRPHDGRVSIEDVEQARHLLRDQPDVHGDGHLLVVTIDERCARILDFKLDTAGTEDTEHDVRDNDARSRHLRTVERHTGHDDEQLLNKFFDDVATALWPYVRDHRFVVFGHGYGKSDTAADFARRLRERHQPVAHHLAAVAALDLSAANDTRIEQAARRLVHAGGHEDGAEHARWHAQP